MATPAQFRRIALAQPGAEEKSHFEQPDFRVNGKIFAGLPREKGSGVLKLPVDVMWSLVRESDAFAPAKGLERGGWTLFRLVDITAARLRELMPLAWATVAPKRLQAESKAPGKRPARKARPTRGS